MNLGWKLAATIPRPRTAKPARQLYARAPSGGSTSSGLVTRTSRPHADRAAARARSKRSFAISSMHETVPAYFAERVWGVSLRYDLGSSHPLAGRSAPDFELTDGTRLGELLRKGNGVLLDFDSREPLRALAPGWKDRILYVARDAKDRLGLRRGASAARWHRRLGWQHGLG